MDPVHTNPKFGPLTSKLLVPFPWKDGFPGHSLTILERIATVCGVALKFHAVKKPNFDREVALV
jgi:hypothetical protein